MIAALWLAIAVTYPVTFQRETAPFVVRRPLAARGVISRVRGNELPHYERTVHPTPLGDSGKRRGQSRRDDGQWPRMEPRRYAEAESWVPEHDTQPPSPVGTTEIDRHRIVRPSKATVYKRGLADPE